MPAFATLTRLQALALVVAIWAAIYLPALGTLEIKGEEGRRILPGVAMLDTGDWIVPTVGGVPYFNKPPLINWLIAASFELTDIRNEWTARLPSALAALAMALTLVGALAAWLTPPGAFLAAVFFLTNISLMEKGRLAEIESLYLSLCGMAIVTWLAAWRAGASPWRTWLVPAVFLGLGLLTKGPLPHLLCFYAVVVAVLVFARRSRDLWHPAHFVGIIVMLAIFAAWFVPYSRHIPPSQAAGRWYTQIASRMELGEEFRLGAWLLNSPRGICNFLPWTVLLPLAWRRLPAEAGGGSLDHAVVRGLRWALAGCFAVVCLAPGGVPRYTLPLVAPACVLLALTLRLDRPALPPWLPLAWGRTVQVCLGAVVAVLPVAVAVGGGRAFRWIAALALAGAALLLWKHVRRWQSPGPDNLPALAAASAAVMALITAIYALGAIRPILRAENVRPVGLQIRDAVAAGGGRAAVLQPGFLPFLFYVDHPVYLQRISDLPSGTRHLLVRRSDLPKAAAALQQQGLVHHISLNSKDKRIGHGDRSEWLLLVLERPGGPGL